MHVPVAESQLLNYAAAVPKVHEETDEEEVHDITHETEDDSLSIEKKEKELILRALQKNNNRRKNAARDLGISERTLYRKIKQYDLEE
jgi:transcriptional regulator with PAS, ATPase and Fis domain